MFVYVRKRDRLTQTQRWLWVRVWRLKDRQTDTGTEMAMGESVKVGRQFWGVGSPHLLLCGIRVTRVMWPVSSHIPTRLKK